jgi:putative ubiquitin-RnfH superfamily antitoxin RatB of RatAB toxin-antitoxin module
MSDAIFPAGLRPIQAAKKMSDETFAQYLRDWDMAEARLIDFLEYLAAHVNPEVTASERIEARNLLASVRVFRRARAEKSR